MDAYLSNSERLLKKLTNSGTSFYLDSMDVDERILLMNNAQLNSNSKKIKIAISSVSVERNPESFGVTISTGSNAMSSLGTYFHKENLVFSVDGRYGRALISEEIEVVGENITIYLSNNTGKVTEPLYFWVG